MSRFFVGQRVRKARGVHNVGYEGTVVELRVSDRQTVSVAWDRPGIAIVSGVEAPIPAKHPSWCRPEQLEPILPEGHQPSEFASLRDLLDAIGVTA